MAWKYILDRKASKALSKLDKKTQQQILNYLTVRVMACDDPRDLGKGLRHDMQGLWRYRVDKYRIICQIQDAVLVILVIEIGKRDAIYEK